MKCFACCALCYCLLGMSLLAPTGEVGEDRNFRSVLGYGVEALTETVEGVEDAAAGAAEAAVNGVRDGIWGLGGFCTLGQNRADEAFDNDDNDGETPSRPAYPLSGGRTVCAR